MPPLGAFEDDLPPLLNALDQGASRAQRAITGPDGPLVLHGEVLENGEVLLIFAPPVGQAQMVRELNHRLKNLFAVISGTITLAARDHGAAQGFAQDMRRLIEALGRAHDASLPGGTADLGRLAEALLTPDTSAARIHLEGPPLPLPPDTLSLLGLILHEWRTNAVKHGALGQPDGQLHLRWSLDDGELNLVWQETGAPVPQDLPSGTGTELVAQSVQRLHGELRHIIGPKSLEMRLTLPV